MKHILILSFLIIVILSMACCTNNNRKNDNKNIDSLDIHISNGTNTKYNGTISISNSRNETVFNKSFSIELKGQIDYKNVTNEIDNYKLTIILNDGRIKTSNEVAVNEFRHMVDIYIGNDDIKISQKLE